MDILDELTRAHRELVDGKRKTVTLRRRYDAEVEDVWDACTDPDRLRRWFAPVSGELRLGGTYRIEGNAGGEILHCEPPRRFTISWLFGENPGFSEVEVSLTPEGDGTLFELRHTAEVPEEFWSQFGPGATGVGWDLVLLGLALHLTGAEKPEESTFHLTDDGRAYILGSSQAWGEAHRAAGGTPAEVESTVAAVSSFYAPQP